MLKERPIWLMLAWKRGLKSWFISVPVGAVGKNTSKGESFINENTPWNPSLVNSKYALSKYRAELEVYRGISEGINAVIVNPGFIMGQTDNWQDGTGKIFSIIDRGLRFYNQGN